MLLGLDKSPAGQALAKSFKTDFAKRFKIEIMGAPTKFLLGMEIKRTATSLTLSQSNYISKVADKFLSGLSTRTFKSPVASSKPK